MKNRGWESDVPDSATPEGLIDSHCHLQDSRFDDDRDASIERAREAGVSALVVIGLDFYRNLSSQEAQRRAFREQLNLARNRELPVVIHSRQADEETFEILADYAGNGETSWTTGRPVGVMHCFAGELTLAQRYIDLGFVISIPGTVTYPDAERLRAVARGVLLRSMVIETDAPYLPPLSQRGRRNEPAYLAETAGFVASLRGETFAEVATGTSATAGQLFGLPAGEPSAPLAGERA
jgi:TatD DNase family protein